MHCALRAPRTSHRNIQTTGRRRTPPSYRSRHLGGQARLLTPVYAGSHKKSPTTSTPTLSARGRSVKTIGRTADSLRPKDRPWAAPFAPKSTIANHTGSTSTTGTLEDDGFSERSPASSALPSPVYPTELAPRPTQHRSRHLSPQDVRSRDSRYQDTRPQDFRHQQLQDPRYQDSRYQDPRYQDPRFSRITVPASATSTTISRPSDGEVTQKSQRSHKSQKPSYPTPGKRNTIISVGGSPLASSSSRPSKTTSTSTAAGGRFEYASDRSPLQKLELELQIISNEPEEPKPGITRTLSKHQAQRLHRSATVTSRLTTDRIQDPYIHNPDRTSALYESMAPKVKPKDFVVSSGNGKERKYGSGFFNYFHRRRGSSTSSSDNTSSEENTRSGTARGRRDSIARLTIEDMELVEHHTDELLTTDPELNYNAPPQDQGMPFSLYETLSVGLIMLPKSPDTPFFHMIQNPLLQQPRVQHPYRPGEEAESRYPKPRRLSTASVASFSSPNLLGPVSVREVKQCQSTSTLMQYLNAIPSRPVPEPSLFTPRLFVKCGPLLRYLGLRRDGINPRLAKRGYVPTAKEEREVWRGSVMIVTLDERSSYNPPPRLRLFMQSIELLTGGGIKGPSGRRGSGSSFWRKQDGEKQRKFREIVGTKLLSERGITWWRFTIEIELMDKQARIAYRINHGPSTAFWVPARGETMNMMFYSCNGFSVGINPDTFCGPDPMWRDVLQSHRRKPFHVMIGGGDQIYNDCVAEQTTHFREWLLNKNPLHKFSTEWTYELSEELELFYMERYCNWFSQGLFGVATSQIPMVNIWDDHDIIDGFGSYPSHFNGCPVFSGLGKIAHKHYLLFQHHTLVYENESHEPSWIMGASPGPYIEERSRSIFMYLGRKVAFLGLDCRTERQRDVIVTADTYKLLFDRARKEIVTGVTKHLIVLLGVPIAYPRLVWLENLLTSRLMDPLKALARMNVLGGLLNSFDGGVEILDDLDDHWTAKNHKAERNTFIKQLQHLAAEKSVRITILGGDVHLAGVGQFYSNPQLGLPKERDHRYMPNVISSAIVNSPPPNTMADVLNKRNKVHHLDSYTDEDMYPMFPLDIDGKPRGNKRLMPRRNYCTLGEYDPIQDPEIADLSKASSRIGIPKFLRSSTQKKGTGQSMTTKSSGKSKQEASDTQQAMISGRDALEVILRVEVNQKNPDGATKPYRLIVPPLATQSYDATGGA